MDGQMTIFEFLPQEEDFCQMSESEVMNIISQRIGVKLVMESECKFKEARSYTAKVGKVNLSAHIDTYSVTHEGSQTLIAGHKYIGCGWGTSCEGGGKPCKSIDEAVEYLKNAIQRGKRK